MRVKFDPQAKEELRAGIEFINRARTGYGDKFNDEVEAYVARIAKQPHQWPRTVAGCRKCRLKRFSYYLIYAEAIWGIYIVAVAHVKQRPDYWKTRLTV